MVCIENWGVEEDEKPVETALPMNELFEDVSNRNFTIKDKSSEVYIQGIGDPYWRNKTGILTKTNKTMRTFLFILLAGLLGACSDDGELNGAVEADNLELSKNELKLSNVAGSSTVDITATADWVAAVVEPVGDAENMWLTLSKDSGTGNDELRLFVTEIQMEPNVLVRLK